MITCLKTFTPCVVNDNVANYSPLVTKQWPLEGVHGNMSSLKSGGSFYSFSKGGGGGDFYHWQGN